MRLLSFLSLALTARGWSDAALAHLGSANQLLNQERFGEAAIEYQAVLESNPRLLTARRDLAVCRFELRQYQAAQNLLSELLLQPSTHATATYYLGRINLAQGEFSAAIARFLSLSHAHPFRDERYFLGLAYYKSAQWENSVRTLREAIEENPRDFRGHQLLARALQKTGREQASVEEFAETRKLLSYYTEGSQALKRCGQILSNTKADEIAKACGPLLRTDDVDKLAAAGTLLGKAGFFQEAEAAWKRAASLDGDSAEIHYNLALTCFHLNDRACARDNAKSAIETRPDFAEANILYASVLYTLGADGEALPVLRKANQLSPQDSSVRELLSNELMLWAEHYVQTGKIDSARPLIAELDRLRPLQPEQEERLLEIRKVLDEDRRK